MSVAHVDGHVGRAAAQPGVEETRVTPSRRGPGAIDLATLVQMAAAEALDALFRLGDELEEAGALGRAYRTFLRGARKGSVDCADRVAVMLADGKGVRRDSKEALRWLRWTFRRGSGIAAPNMAVTYAESGRWHLAYRWWQRVNAQGGGEELCLAMCLLEGLGVRRDAGRARELLLRHSRRMVPSVCEFDQAWCLALLGVMAAAGLGCRRDLRVARRWLERATRADDYPEALRVLDSLDLATPRPLDVARGGPWTALDS